MKPRLQTIHPMFHFKQVVSLLFGVFDSIYVSPDLMEDYAKDGVPEVVRLSCSYHHDPLRYQF